MPRYDVIVLDVLVNGSDATVHQSRVREIYDTFDSDNDGEWDLSEFSDHLFLATLSIPLTNPQL